MALAVPPGGTPPPIEPADGRLNPASGHPDRHPVPDQQSASPSICTARRPPSASSSSTSASGATPPDSSASSAGRSPSAPGLPSVVVVDNHSPFHPVVRKLEKLHGVSIRRFSRNLGFARAVNRG